MLKFSYFFNRILNISYFKSIFNIKNLFILVFFKNIIALLIIQPSFFFLFLLHLRIFNFYSLVYNNKKTLSILLLNISSKSYTKITKTEKNRMVKLSLNILVFCNYKSYIYKMLKKTTN